MMALRKDRGKRIQDCGRFAGLLGECIGAARNRDEGRPPNPDSPLRRSSNTTGPISATDTPIGTGVTSPVSIEPGLSSASKLVIGGLGVAFVIIVGAMMFGSGKNDSGDSGDSSATPGMSATPDPTAINVDDLPKNRATIASNIEGSKVFLDDEYKCDTPCTLEIPVGDARDHEIILRKDGYIEVMTKWRPRSVTERAPQLPDLRPADYEVELK
jgi:hypothetical protein